MTEQIEGSTEQLNIAADITTVSAANLLHHYSFDLGIYTVEQLLARWVERYTAQWVQWAIIEALYQGRYKAVSVEQILAFWQRRGHPFHHFNHEFERLVCSKFPRSLTNALGTAPGMPSQVRPLPPREGRSPQPLETKTPLPSNPEPSKPENSGNISGSNGANGSASDNGAIANPPPATVPVKSVKLPWFGNSSQRREKLEAQRAFVQSPAWGTAQLPKHSGNLLNSHFSPGTNSSPVSPMEKPAAQSPEFPSTSQQPTSQVPMMEPTQPYKPNWVGDSNDPIHQFTPIFEASEFYIKLRAVAQSPDPTEAAMPDSAPSTQVDENPESME